MSRRRKKHRTATGSLGMQAKSAPGRSLRHPVPRETLRPRDWLFAAALVVAVFLAYQPAWRGGFIWDNQAHVTRPELRSWHGLDRIWFDLGATQQYYPLLHSAFGSSTSFGATTRWAICQAHGDCLRHCCQCRGFGTAFWENDLRTTVRISLRAYHPHMVDSRDFSPT